MFTKFFKFTFLLVCIVQSTELYAKESEVLTPRLVSESSNTNIEQYTKSDVKKLNAIDTFKEIYDDRNVNKLVTLSTNKKNYKISKDGDHENDYVDITVSSDTNGFLYLLMLGTDTEQIVFLLPNEEFVNNKLIKDKSVTIKSKILAMGPSGTDHLLAIVSDTPLEYKSMNLEKIGPYSFMQSNEVGLRNLKLLTSSSSIFSTPKARKKTKGKTPKALNNVILACTESKDRNLKYQVSGTPIIKPEKTLKCGTKYGASLISIEEYE